MLSARKTQSIIFPRLDQNDYQQRLFGTDRDVSRCLHHLLCSSVKGIENAGKTNLGMYVPPHRFWRLT